MESLDLRLKLSSSFWDKAPYVGVTVDDVSLFNGQVSESIEINWSGNLNEGTHSLNIELYNKDKYQTIIENGEILKDQILNIDNIYFDDIEVGFLKWSHSEYITKHPGAPNKLVNCVNLGYNGIWTLKFNTPIYIWLLENL